MKKSIVSIEIPLWLKKQIIDKAFDEFLAWKWLETGAPPRPVELPTPTRNRSKTAKDIGKTD